MDRMPRRSRNDVACSFNHEGIPVRAVEDLITTVRDQRSREQLMDAVRAYQSGALRACVVSTWVAVALDLTAKIRELADGGDGAATWPRRQPPVTG